MTALVPVDPSSAVAVTSYLEQARNWLATAIEQTGPEQIARAKAEIATAAEATKQLQLGKEIQDDAIELVRRAEWTLRKATKKAQGAGEMRSRATNLTPGRSRSGETSTPIELPRPRDVFATEVEYRDALAMGELNEAQFETVLAEAKAEGNLSRANVARKAREISGKPRKTPRRPLIETSRHAGLDLMTAVERIERVLGDDRYRSEAEQVAPQLRNHLTSAIETLTGLLDRINE